MVVNTRGGTFRSRGGGFKEFQKTEARQTGQDSKDTQATKRENEKENTSEYLQKLRQPHVKRVHTMLGSGGFKT